MANSMVVVALSGVVGALAALATVTLMASDHTEPKAPHAMTSREDSKESPEAFQPATIVVQAETKQLQALRQEVDQLRNEHIEAEKTIPPDPEAEMRRSDELLADMDRRYHQDPVDPRWSPGATNYLAEGLTVLSKEIGFGLRSAECKTAMCRATLEWPDYASAQRTGFQLAEREFPGLNCEQTIRLKPPENPGAPYSTNLYLDCTSQRTGSVEVASTEQQTK